MASGTLDGGGRYGNAVSLGNYHSGRSALINDTLNKRESSEWYKFRFRSASSKQVHLSTSVIANSGEFTATQVKAQILQQYSGQN